MKAAARDVHDCLTTVLAMFWISAGLRRLRRPAGVSAILDSQPVAQGNKLRLMRTALPVAQPVDTLRMAPACGRMP